MRARTCVSVHVCRVGQNHIYIYIYGVHDILGRKSPNIRSYTVYIYTYIRFWPTLHKWYEIWVSQMRRAAWLLLAHTCSCRQITITTRFKTQHLNYLMAPPAYLNETRQTALTKRSVWSSATRCKMYIAATSHADRAHDKLTNCLRCFFKDW
jgi:hypothetical protein